MISIHDMLITFNNGLGPLKTKSGGSREVVGGACVGWGFYYTTVLLIPMKLKSLLEMNIMLI